MTHCLTNPTAFNSFPLSAPFHQLICSPSLLNNILTAASSWLMMMSEEIYRALLIAFFSLQSSLLAFVPYIGSALLGLHLCWLYAFTSFEYTYSPEPVEIVVNLLMLKQLIFALSQIQMGHGALELGAQADVCGDALALLCRIRFVLLFPLLHFFPLLFIMFFLLALISGFPATVFTFMFPYWVFQGLYALIFPMVQWRFLVVLIRTFHCVLLPQYCLMLSLSLNALSLSVHRVGHRG